MPIIQRLVLVSQPISKLITEHFVNLESSNKCQYEEPE